MPIAADQRRHRGWAALTRDRQIAEQVVPATGGRVSTVQVYDGQHGRDRHWDGYGHRAAGPLPVNGTVHGEPGRGRLVEAHRSSGAGRRGHHQARNGGPRAPLSVSY